LAFEAFAFATPIILKVFVSEFHSLQTGTRFIAKVMIHPTSQPFPLFYWATGNIVCCLQICFLRIREKRSKTAIFTVMTDVHNKAIRSFNMS
jgi:hypothetical protein